jgi:hypothetical protein
MSHYMTALAMKQTGLKPATKIVLYWIADHHNGETGACFPSIKRLSKCCEMAPRSIHSHIDALVAANVLKVVGRVRDDGAQTSNEYHLNLIETQENTKKSKEAQQRPEGVQNLHRGGADIAEGPMQNLQTINLGNINLGIEPSIAAQNKRACTLPEGWVVSNKNIQDALERNFSNEEIKHESHQFSNYHFSKGTKFKDWDAAWRTWLGNSRKFTKARSSRPSGGHDALMAGFAAYADRFGD